LELTERGLRPARRGGFSHHELDDLRWSISLAVIRRCTPREIRAKSLANLHRWKQQGAWVSAFEEWREILESEDDGRLSLLGQTPVDEQARERIRGQIGSDFLESDDDTSE